MKIGREMYEDLQAILRLLQERISEFQRAHAELEARVETEHIETLQVTCDVHCEFTVLLASEQQASSLSNHVIYRCPKTFHDLHVRSWHQERESQWQRWAG